MEDPHAHFVVELDPSVDCDSEELRARSRQSSKGKKTVQLRALRDETELAFIAIERWPEFNHLFLYELFVPRDLRRQGIGSAVLNAVERLAADEGYSAVRVRPKPLDKSINGEALETWYRRRGYAPVANIPGDMEKRLPGGL